MSRGREGDSWKVAWWRRRAAAAAAAVWWLALCLACPPSAHAHAGRTQLGTFTNLSVPGEFSSTEADIRKNIDENKKNIIPSSLYYSFVRDFVNKNVLSEANDEENTYKYTYRNKGNSYTGLVSKYNENVFNNTLHRNFIKRSVNSLITPRRRRIATSVPANKDIRYNVNTNVYSVTATTSYQNDFISLNKPTNGHTNANNVIVKSLFNTNIITYNNRSMLIPVTTRDTRVAYVISATQETEAVEESRGCEIGGRYPPVAEGTKTLLLGVLMTQLGTVRERLGLKIPGAVSYAVHTVNENNLLPENYTLQFEMKDTMGGVVESTYHVSNFVCNHVAGFIGPEHTCHVEATIAAAHNLPMISYACSDATMGSFSTFARTNPSEKPMLRVTVETLKHFKWWKFSIIYMEEFRTMAETLQEIAHHNNLTINHIVPVAAKEQFPKIISATKNATRIYVFLAHRAEVLQMLLTMSLAGLIQAGVNNHYMLVYVDREEYKPHDWFTYMFDATTSPGLNFSERCVNEKEKLLTFDRSFMVIGNRAPVSTFTKLEDNVRKYNTMAPFCLGLYNDKNLYRHMPYLALSYLYDAVVQYALAVARLYKQMRLLGNVTVEEVAANGTAIIQQLRDHTYQSILGYSVTMDNNAQSEGNYSVYLFYGHPNCSADDREFPCSHCLVKISDTVNYELDTSINILVLDEPLCGYDHNLCTDTSIYARQVSAIVMAVMLVLMVFWSTIQYRKWKYEQEIAGLQWRINKNELCQLNSGYAFGSRTSLTSVVSHDVHGQLYFPALAEYRGSVVCVKLMTMDGRSHKKPDLSRHVMKEIRKMREMKQDNVCMLVGAYLDDMGVTTVTEYCHRGSLEDILENEDIKLDELFVASMVHDLIRGMLFLHNHYGPHGNLKSSNCVVTGRWVLQVTDYGLHDLRREAFKNITPDDYDMSTEEGKRFLKGQLWRSPELLRKTPDWPGSREADIYAFAIVLHEIIGRQGPFAIYNGECPNYADILSDVKKGQTIGGNLMRPSLLELTSMPFGSNSDVVSCMISCWAEDPSKRMEFRNIKVALKNIMEERRKGNLMDHIVKLLHEYSKNLEDLVGSRTLELREEKRKTDDLLHRMLPPQVASCLTRNRPVEPQNFDSVTIYFSDIVGFTAICADSTPFQVVTFLDELYRMFDSIISGYDVYKVETIGDAYMVVSGLPTRNNGRHAGEIASMALELVQQTKTNFKIAHKPDETLSLRVGLHTGPVMAGVVGLAMPRYCLFGDTVNTAARLESNGAPLRVHISEQCKDALMRLGGYVVEERGLVEMKGKGEVLTFWLEAALASAVQRRPQPTDGVKKRPSVFQGMDGEGMELRRRSPRMSADYRRLSLGGRSSIASRSYDGSGENLVLRRGVREASPLSRESPRLDGLNTPRLDGPNTLQRRRKLSSGVRASSLECTMKGGLLSPPHAIGSQQAVGQGARGSHSLEQLHSHDQPVNLLLKVPTAPFNISNGASPASSEPTLPVEEAPRVNFSSNIKNTNDSDEENIDLTLSPTEEIEPMLEDNSTGVELKNNSDNDANKSQPAGFRSWLSGLLKPSLPSSKLSMNGLQRESLV